MKVQRSRLSKIIAERLASGEPLEKVAEETAAYLMSENRVGELDSLLRDIQAYRAEHGVVETEAISAFPLSGDVRAEVEKQIRNLYPNAQQVLVSERQDDDVIGGVKLRLAHQQLDLTVRSTLNRFKQLTAAGD